MDMQTMKHIDRFAGYPLCGALRIFDVIRTGSLKKRNQTKEAAEALAKSAEKNGRPLKIAVIKFWGMGSLILSAPLFNSLRKSYPNAEIHLITLQNNRGFLELLDLADKVHYLDLSGSAATIAARIMSFFVSVNRIQPDVIIDLEYLTRFSALVSYFSGAPVRVGYHSWDVWRGNLQTVRCAFNPYWHITDNFLNLHKTLGATDAQKEPVSINLSGSEDREADELLAAAGASQDERIIAVNANASTVALARRWPEEYFVELIDRMVEQNLGRIALLGAPDEAAYVNRLQKKLKRPDAAINLAGKSSLRGLVGILRRARLLVTNDSGPLHLAGALGTPTVSFFGPETPTLFGPMGEGHEILYCGIDCSPCINIYNAKTVRCMRDEPECLSLISVDQALDAVSKVLKEKP